MTELESIACVLYYCDIGFDNYSTSYYNRIVEELSPFVGNKHIDDAVRLAGSGHLLDSPRFAYPQIVNCLRARQRELAGVK